MLGRVNGTYDNGTARVTEERCFGLCTDCPGCTKRKSYLCHNDFGAKTGELVVFHPRFFRFYWHLRKKAGFIITGYPGKRFGIFRE